MNIEKGKLVAFRVIKDTINVGAFGLGEPIDIWTMKLKEKGKIEIVQLAKKEIIALNDAYIT